VSAIEKTSARPEGKLQAVCRLLLLSKETIFHPQNRMLAVFYSMLRDEIRNLRIHSQKSLYRNLISKLKLERAAQSGWCAQCV
jgi:hypothetical protein